MSKMQSSRFTLIEILIVMSIILVLAGLSIAVMGPVKRNIRDTKTKAQIKQFEMVFEQYYQDWGYYPQQGSPGPITALMFSSLRSSDQGAPFFRREDFDFDTSDSLTVSGIAYQRPVNAFSQVFYYESPGTVHPDGFDIWCAGYDGVFGPGGSASPSDAQASNARTDDSSDDLANWKRLH